MKCCVKKSALYSVFIRHADNRAFLKGRLHHLSLKKAEKLTVPLFFQIRLGYETQGRRVDAIPQARGRRTFTEDVSQVGIRMLAAVRN